MRQGFQMIITSIWILLLPILVLGGTNEEGLKFLEENAKKDGVITLPSGLQYKVLTKGGGPYHPSVGTPCLCHYSGTLIDGTKFDSSYDRGEPTTFAPNQVIKGWTEAMQLMTVGDKWELYIPSELGYGDHGSPPKIPGGSVLVFTMEIIEMQGNSSDWVPALACNPIVKPPENCSPEEIKYISRIIDAWDLAKKTSEQARIKKMLADDSKSNVKPELVSWMNRRLHILNQFVEDGATKAEL
jgi:FKBP-type peptidyl-prolyl cis-trans isomerase FklB